MKFTVSSNIKNTILVSGGIAFTMSVGLLAVLIFIVLQISSGRSLASEMQLIAILFVALVVLTVLMAYYNLSMLVSVAMLQTSIDLHIKRRTLYYEKCMVDSVQIEETTYAYSARWTERYYLATINLETGEQIKLALDSKATFVFKEQVDKKTDTKVVLK